MLMKRVIVFSCSSTLIFLFMVVVHPFGGRQIVDVTVFNSCAIGATTLQL